MDGWVDMATQCHANASDTSELALRGQHAKHGLLPDLETQRAPQRLGPRALRLAAAAAAAATAAAAAAGTCEQINTVRIS